jgi:histidinol phosphatase-like PHP family hydrolase
MENLLREFRKSLNTRNYLFHIHTNYTDGISDINNYFEYASQNNINVIIFTEHVRKKLKYDFDVFVNDIEKVNKIFPKIETYIGCEAKLLPGGDLDIPISILTKIKVICFACHSFPQDIELYRSSFKKLFTDNQWKNYIRIWVHPGRFLKKLNLLNKNMKILEELIEIALSEDILIENNLREVLPPKEILEKIPNENIVIGYDAHSIDEIEILKRLNGYEHSLY